MSLDLESIEEALWAAAGEKLPAGALDPRVLAEAIHERTRRYTSERHRLGGRNDARDLAARALFFSVADAAKPAILVGELRGRGLLPERELAVLDLGAGCGAMSLGLAAAGLNIRVTAIDQDGDALGLFAAAAGKLGLEVSTRTADATAALPAGPFDLIVAGTVVNELPVAARLPLVRQLMARLVPDGALLLLEPALRETSRALHTLRDQILEHRVAHVFAPCTRTLAPCPALADPDDWCHEDRPFQPPPRLRRLIAATGLRAHGLKLAYLTLRHGGEPLVAVPVGRRALRVVSDARDGKGTVERFVCGDDGRFRGRVLRRDKGEDKRAFAHSRRGDVIVDDGAGDKLGSLELVRPGDD